MQSALVTNPDRQGAILASPMNEVQGRARTNAHEQNPLCPVVWDAEGVCGAPGHGQEAADERSHQGDPGHVEDRHVRVLRPQLAHTHLGARAAQRLDACRMKLHDKD